MAVVSATDPACLRLPLRSYPGINPFVADWLESSPKATAFLPRPAVPRVPRVRSVPDDLVAALIESNRRWGLFVREDVERWASGSAVAIVAGQQVGFGGGPIYTLAKIASMLRMKRSLEVNGTPATVFFWLATEDHDYDEVARLSLPASSVSKTANINRQLDLVHLRASRGVESRQVVGQLPMPQTLIQELLALYEMERPPWLREGISFRDSFAELLAEALGGGVVLVDALLPELRRAGSALFAAIAERWSETQQVLDTHSSDLSSAGYAPQITKTDDEYTLLYQLDQDGVRRAFDRAALQTPESISTSAITRPLLQDSVLQPDIFVGGPAEVAYYAQIFPLYELFGVTPPRVALRGHALLAPKRVLKVFSRFDIEPQDVFRPLDEVLAEQEPEGAKRVREHAAKGREQLFAQIEAIRELALPADHAVSRSINRSIGHLDYHFTKLAERAIRGLVRKDKERHLALKEVAATFYPDRHVQDRVVGWLPFWCTYGKSLVDRLIEEIEPDSDRCVMIGL